MAFAKPKPWDVRTASQRAASVPVTHCRQPNPIEMEQMSHCHVEQVREPQKIPW